MGARRQRLRGSGGRAGRWGWLRGEGRVNVTPFRPPRRRRGGRGGPPPPSRTPAPGLAPARQGGRRAKSTPPPLPTHTGSGSSTDYCAEGHARGQGGGARTPTVAATATSPHVRTVGRGPRTTRLEGLGVRLAHVFPMLHVQLELVLLHQWQDLRGGLRDVWVCVDPRGCNGRGGSQGLYIDRSYCEIVGGMEEPKGPGFPRGAYKTER